MINNYNNYSGFSGDNIMWPRGLTRYNYVEYSLRGLSGIDLGWRTYC